MLTEYVSRALRLIASVITSTAVAVTSTAVAVTSTAIAVLFAALAASSTALAASPPTQAPLEILSEQPPVTLNPRQALDATSQKVNALLYASLVKMNRDLKPTPDLASSWTILDRGHEIRFAIRPGLKDHEGHPITPAALAACLEQYRTGQPVSPYLSSFPHWKATTSTGNSVTLRLDRPDPYLLGNLSMLKYFRVASSPIPCSEPQAGEPVIGSGDFRMEPWDPRPERELRMVPMNPDRFLAAHFRYIPDETARVLSALRGGVDAALSAFSLTHERWLQKQERRRYRLIEHRSTNVGYIAFNLRDPILGRKEVRRAIALSIDRALIVRTKMMGFGSLAGSLLAPELPESVRLDFPYDPALAEELLDRAGFPRKSPGGERFEIHYKTTPVREGFENALIFREMLAKVGIRITLEVVEPAVFLQSVRKGNFQMFSSRWIGIADGSILYRTLYSKSPDDRGHYSNPKVDELLEGAETELDPARRARLLAQVQRIMLEDLPYFPLWFWSQGLIVRKDHPILSKIRSDDLSLSGALEPLLLLR